MTNPFSFIDYHYYEPEVYSMGIYFEGFNFRQLKTIQFTFNQVSLSYGNFKNLLTKTSLEKEIELELDSLYQKILKISNFIGSFKETNKNGTQISLVSFDTYYTRKMNNRRWVREVDDLKRFCGNYHNPLFKVSFANKFDILFNRGYWLEYLRTACFENEFEDPKLNEFDLGIFDELYTQAISIRMKLIKSGYKLD